MERIKFIADTSGDISQEDAQRLDIQLVPMGIVVDGKFCQDRVDFNATEFYEILKKSKEVPTSVAINPQAWYEVLEEHVKSGAYDRLVITTVGTPLSSTSDAAVQARESLRQDYPEAFETLKIDIYDSATTTAGFGYPVVRSAEMHQEGVPYSEIQAFLQQWYNCFHALFVAFSFDIPRKSGRINAASAYIGGKLNIRPIMNVIDGVFSLNAKVRGDSNVVKKLIEIAKELSQPDSPLIMLCGDNPSFMDQVVPAMEGAFDRKIAKFSQAGPAMVVNGGVEMFCLGFLGKDRGTTQNPR